MGSDNSTPGARDDRSDADVIAIMMPIYFVKEDPSEEDVKVASTTWDMVLSKIVLCYFDNIPNMLLIITTFILV